MRENKNPRQNLRLLWWGLLREIRTGNQRVGKEKDDC